MIGITRIEVDIKDCK